MILVKENGTGVAGANTYIDLDYANTYMSDMGYSDWAMIGAAARTSSILRAMNYIEALPWKGYKADKDYPLEWPRAGVIDGNEYPVDEDIIPEKLMKAQAEAALREIETGTLQPDVEGPSNIQTMKAGSLAITYFDGKSGTGSQFTVIEGLLSGFVIGGTKVFRT